MSGLQAMIERLRGLVEMGGPVIALIAGVSVATLAVILYKLWQFRAARVGQHHALRAAVSEWDRGEAHAARRTLDRSRSHLAPVISRAFTCHDPRDSMTVTSRVTIRLFLEDVRFVALPALDCEDGRSTLEGAVRRIRTRLC